MNILGIDIGGTKTSVCIGNEKGDLLASRRMPSHPETGYEDYVRRTTVLTHELLKESGVSLKQIEGVGISAPGPLSVKEGILLCAPNMEGWINVPIPKGFREALGRPAYMNNDANGCALAEWMFGEFKGAYNLIYLTMSTGLGAGIIANGKLLQGAADLAGEVGFHVIDPDGPEWSGHHRGSWEAFCGGKNVADRLRRRIVEEKIRTAILDKAGGDPAKIDFKAFTDAVRARDAFALEAWEEFIEHLAQGIGNLLMILNPEAIVLGTIAIKEHDLVMPALEKALPKYAIDPAIRCCRIRPSILGGKIGDLSAVAIAIDAMKSTRGERA